MNITTLRSDHIYKMIAEAASEDKVELFRNELLAPFMKQWHIQQIPFRAAAANGFDVLTMNNMMHRSPDQITAQIADEIEQISSESFWMECEHAVKTSLSLFGESSLSVKG